MTIRRVIARLGAAVAVLLLAAVVHSEPVTLEDWLDQDAGPFFADKLASHPRFRGERVRLVPMRGERVLTAADGLSLRIQARLADHLLKKPGVRLAFEPRPHDAFVLPTADGYDCLRDADVTYLIGVQIESLAANRHRVSLRVLDLAERGFVSGAVRQWVGRLGPAERNVYNDPGAIAAAPGTRQRPFAQGESDRLASSLARDLVCQLERRRAGDVSVFVPVGADDGAGVDPALVGHYLAAQREVLIVSERSDADLVLDLEAHGLEGTLTQVWARLVTVGVADGVPGASASVYASVPGGTQDRLEVAANAARPARVDDIPDHVTQADGPLQKTAGPLLARPRVIVPLHPALCRTRDPWRRGASSPFQDGDLSGAGCFALEVHAARESELYLVARLDSGALVRMPPDGCQTRGSRRATAVHGTGALRFPRGGEVPALPVARDRRVETLIFLAAETAGTPALLAEHIAALPSACVQSARSRHDADRWIEETQAVMAMLGGTADWQAITVRHGR